MLAPLATRTSNGLYVSASAWPQGSHPLACMRQLLPGHKNSNRTIPQTYLVCMNKLCNMQRIRKSRIMLCNKMDVWKYRQADY